MRYGRKFVSSVCLALALLWCIGCKPVRVTYLVAAGPNGTFGVDLYANKWGVVTFEAPPGSQYKISTPDGAPCNETFPIAADDTTGVATCHVKKGKKGVYRIYITPDGKQDKAQVFAMHTDGCGSCGKNGKVGKFFLKSQTSPPTQLFISCQGGTVSLNYVVGELDASNIKITKNSAVEWILPGDESASTWRVTSTPAAACTATNASGGSDQCQVTQTFTYGIAVTGDQTCNLVPNTFTITAQ